MKKFVFALAFMAVATSTAWAQNDAFSNAPYGHEQGYYYYGSHQVEGSAYYSTDPTAHYWDYYPLDPGHGIDADRTTPP